MVGKRVVDARARERIQRIYRRKSSKWVYRFIRRGIILVLFPYFRLRCKGAENLNLNIAGPVIVAPIHRSNFDAPLVAGIALRPLRFLAKEQLFSNPVLAWIFASLGSFPVRREVTDRHALRISEDTLRAGKQLLVFPEGSRQSGSKVKGVFDGVGYLASRTGAPVIPIGIAGTEKVMRSGGRLPGRPTVAIVVGNPFYPPKDRMSKFELKRFSDTLHQRLQAVFGEAQQLTEDFSNDDLRTQSSAQNPSKSRRKR